MSECDPQWDDCTEVTVQYDVQPEAWGGNRCGMYNTSTTSHCGFQKTTTIQCTEWHLIALASGEILGSTTTRPLGSVEGTDYLCAETMMVQDSIGLRWER